MLTPATTTPVDSSPVTVTPQEDVSPVESKENTKPSNGASTQPSTHAPKVPTSSANSKPAYKYREGMCMVKFKFICIYRKTQRSRRGYLSHFTNLFKIQSEFCWSSMIFSLICPSIICLVSVALFKEIDIWLHGVVFSHLAKFMYNEYCSDRRGCAISNSY